jgi:hypothetical protein
MKDFWGCAIGFTGIGFGLCLVLLKDNIVLTGNYEYYIDKNISLKEVYFRHLPNEYKQRHTDWKQFEDIKENR